MIPVLNPGLFFQWEIYIVGPFPKSKGQAQYIIIVVDYAAKWIEAKQRAKLREKEMVEFLMKFIVFHFGVPRIVVTNYSTQFVGKTFTNTLSDLKIKHVKASVAYPQANGLIEQSIRVEKTG